MGIIFQVAGMWPLNGNMASVEGGDEGPEKLDSSAIHALSVLKSLQKLRESSQFCDVQLCVDSKVFPAHRNVLAASSPYFNAMLCGSLAEGSKSSISIYGIPADVFSKLIDYIYTGKCIPTRDGIYSWKQKYSTPLTFSINCYSKQVVQQCVLCLQ